MTIRVSEPNFRPVNAVYNMVAVWIRLLELPIEYYELSVLREVGSTIGLVLRIDSNTGMEVRSRYA